MVYLVNFDSQVAKLGFNKMKKRVSCYEISNTLLSLGFSQKQSIFHSLSYYFFLLNTSTFFLSSILF